MLLFVIFCLLGCTFAQLPKPCISPGQWEARVRTSNPQLKAELFGKLTYDSVYHRTRILQDVTVGTTETYYDIITFYEGKLAFFIDKKTDVCSRVPFDQPWRDYGIQADARFVREAYIGSSAVSSSGLLVTVWSGNTTIPINQTATYIGTWTYDGCLPISDITFEPHDRINYTFFYDITIGISDPNVFIPPRQCLTEKEYNMRHTLFGSLKSKNLN
ncbi:unnamed protein product [Rotaria socialis]|uniref:Mammalian ependymin-related protein 1 n=2 Tax=Rotaria socialis TaxID=392032 RepID=A0A820Q0Z7_9BILA|nr:unnamed protein product [Rotaria socialis]CAF3381554.1 unnamed protein product [Rotaria socialis]CAF4413311.1 unnamed protein product [Rotaria socialis]CAF4561064.1 unnamed protein product [Rotaria socialis]